MRSVLHKSRWLWSDTMLKDGLVRRPDTPPLPAGAVRWVADSQDDTRLRLPSLFDGGDHRPFSRFGARPVRPDGTLMWRLRFPPQWWVRDRFMNFRNLWAYRRLRAAQDDNRPANRRVRNLWSPDAVHVDRKKGGPWHVGDLSPHQVVHFPVMAVRYDEFRYRRDLPVLGSPDVDPECLRDVKHRRRTVRHLGSLYRRTKALRPKPPPGLRW